MLITEEIANNLTPEEAARISSDSEFESREALHIITCKTLFHLAAKDELEMLVGEDGKILFRGKLR